MKTIGPDPHGDLSTGTGHSKEGITHDHDVANRKIKLTNEEQDIWDGKKGPVMAQLIKTVVQYGNAFGADKLVDLGGNPHTVLMFAPGPLKPVIDIFNKCADAGLKAYAPYTIDPRPYDFYNVEMEPELQLEFGEAYPIQDALEKAHLRLGGKNMNYWS